MNPFRRLTNRDLIERTERFENRSRRPVAWLLVFCVAGHLACGAWFVYLLFWKHQPFMFDEMTQTSYEIGLMIGYLLAKSSFFLLFAIIFALSALFGGRKDRMLVAYFHRLKEMNQLTSDGQLEHKR